MSQWDKLLLKIKCLAKDVRFNELRKILESLGYVMSSPQGGSSHYTFRKEKCQPITIPCHNPIKTVYVKKIKSIIENEENKNE